MNTISLTWGTLSFTAGIDSAHIAGVGGPWFPRLLVPIKLHFYEMKDHELNYAGLSAQLCTQGGTVVSEAATRPFVYGVKSSFPAQHQIEFPFSPSELDRLEALRHAQSVFALQVDIQVVVQIRRISDSTVGGLSQEGIHPISGTLPFEIAISHWCERIAPGLGIGLIRLFELPATPLSEVADYQRAHDSLTRAHKKFMMGEYDDAVAECRKAIEPIRQHLQKKKLLEPGVLAADYADKVGQATAEWLTILLGKTHGVANEPHHSTRACFNRLDAQMILTITVSLIAYILRSRE